MCNVMLAIDVLILFSLNDASFLPNPAGAAAQRDCAAPPQYPHTALFDKYACQQRFGSGRKVSYKCQPDFEYFAGSRFAQCMDGRWTKLTMKCRSKKMTFVFGYLI